MSRIEENENTWKKILNTVEENRAENDMIFEVTVVRQLNIMNALLHDMSKSLAVIADAQFKEE